MTPCIEHNWPDNGGGYGRKKLNGKRILAHRYYYSLKYGEIAPALVLRHKCDNPRCINTDHLEPGTQLDNINDRQTRKRQAVGTSNARTKINSTLVDYILSSTESSRKLAKELNVSHTTIQWTRRGLTFTSASKV